jgi:Flp pilus assembly protein TadD
MPENQENPLKHIAYIELPEEMERDIGDFHVDPDKRLPVELLEGNEKWTMEHLSWEMIISAMLKILAHEPNHGDADYYRDFVLAARPRIVDELTETAVLKTRNKDFELAEEMFLALKGLLPEERRVDLNIALHYEQRADAAAASSDDEAADELNEQAFFAYRSLLEDDEVLPEAHFNAGFFFLKRNNYERAREQLDAYRDVGSDQRRLDEANRIIADIDDHNLMDTLFKEAYDYIRLGREREGIDKIRKFLDENPGVWNAWFLLGWAHRRLEEYGEAKEAFLRAIELGSSESDTYNELAICQMELEEYEESRKSLEQALRLSPEDTKVISNLGILALKRDRREEAKAYFLTVLELEPLDPIARRYLETL